MQFNFVTKDILIVNNVEMHKVKSKVGPLSSGVRQKGPGQAGGRAVLGHCCTCEGCRC